MGIGRMMGAALGAALIGAAGPVSAAETVDLVVVVGNLRSAEGDVRVALWRGPDGFTQAAAALVTSSQPAALGHVGFAFRGLPPGRYAIATYHDENGNGVFDRTWFGLPKEGLGFSNGARIGFGPPRFEEAAFDISAGTQAVVITIRY